MCSSDLQASEYTAPFLGLASECDHPAWSQRRIVLYDPTPNRVPSGLHRKLLIGCSCAALKDAARKDTKIQGVSVQHACAWWGLSV